MRKEIYSPLAFQYFIFYFCSLLEFGTNNNGREKWQRSNFCGGNELNYYKEK
jgi:hypothetical protein